MTGLEDLYMKEETAGVDAITAWVGHPAVRNIIGEYEPEFEFAVQPLDRHLVDQVAVCLFIMRAVEDEITGLAPDGQQDPNPFTTWDLNDTERESIPEVVGQFREVLAKCTKALADTGVPLAAEANLDQLAVAQLALLEVDWTLPARQIAEELNLVAPSGFTADGRIITHRAKRPQRGWTRAERVRAAHEATVDPRTFPAVYAGGKKRRSVDAPEVRRRVLREFLTEYPDITAGELHHGWNGTGPGRRFAERFEAAMEEEGRGDEAKKVSVWTLNRDLRAIKKTDG